MKLIMEGTDTFTLIERLRAENDRLKLAINEVLEELNEENGVANMDWVKDHLKKAIK